METGFPDPQRPFPIPIGNEYLGHFEGLRRGDLVVRKCIACGNLQWPPRPVCVNCLGGEFNWHEVPTEGVVYSYTVCHRAFDPWFSARAPFAVVVGEVAPGVRIVGNTFDSDVDRLACGVPVEARFVTRDGDRQAMLEWEPS